MIIEQYNRHTHFILMVSRNKNHSWCTNVIANFKNNVSLTIIKSKVLGNKKLLLIAFQFFTAVET